MDEHTEARGNGMKKVLALVGGGIVVCTFALLIWAKLRMVTGVPRTAYADPNEQKQVDGAQAAQEPAVPKPQRRPARGMNRETLRVQAEQSAAVTEQQAQEEAPAVNTGGN